MDESVGKTTSCLAISEKRIHSHRPGGCVGIFFQLFDWNRRLAKKKILSKKLLPPARAKQVLQKFGDEKMPKGKLNLIADENSGGFPNLKKNGSSSASSEQKQELRAPSLVARLMGLESIPATSLDKHKKALLPDRCDDSGVKIVDNSSGVDKENSNLGKGNGKVESRPQKLPKTRDSERLLVARFGGDALHIKNILSQSRKDHHSKLASPVKTPKLPSRKSSTRTSRLIDVATKILEPGLQASNRAKGALTYSSSMHYSSKDEVKKEGKRVLSPELLKQSSYHGCGAKSLMCQSSCTNCGSLLSVVASSISNEEEKPYDFASSPSNCVDASSKELVISKPKTPKSSMEQDTEVNSKKSQYQSVHLSSQVKGNLQIFREGKPLTKANQERWPSSGQSSKLKKEDASFISHNPRTQARNQMSPGRGRSLPRARISALQSRKVPSTANAMNCEKDFVSSNRNLSGRARPRVPTKAEYSSSDIDKKSCYRHDEFLPNLRSSVQKWRTVNTNGIDEHAGSMNSTFGKQWNPRCNALTRKEMGPNSNTQSLDRSYIKSKSVSPGKGVKANGSKDSDVISFTFSSPLRNKSEISTDAEEKGSDQDDSVVKSISPRRKLLLDENDHNTSLWKKLPFSGDALGALLEQNLKEMTYQEEDESATGVSMPKRSTATILQELISALMKEYRTSPDDDAFKRNFASQAKGKAETSVVGFSRNVDHLSPGSVLEASFSNDSYISSSLDDCSGLNLPPDSLDYSYGQPQSSKPDVDLLDSATSLNKPSNEILTDLLNRISFLLQSVDLSGPSLLGRELTHTKDIILNAELLFGYASYRTSDGIINFIMDPLFLDKLENLASATWPNYTHSRSCEETKGRQMKGFLFDCVIEILESKYARYSKCGYQARRKLPLCINKELIICDVDEEVRRWTNFAGKIPDDIIEWEMGHSLGRWTDFNIESYETGDEIDKDILELLVNEIAMDLCES